MTPGRHRWRWWLALPLVAAVLLLGVRALLLDAAPALSPPPVPTAGSMAQLRQWLHWHDPRRAPDGRVLVLHASPADLQLLGGVGARLLGGAARVTLADGRARIEASLPVHGRWANVDLALVDGAGLPAVASLRVGALALPGWLADPALRLVLSIRDRPRDGVPPLHAMVRDVQFRDQGLRLRYQWRADLTRRLAGWLMPAPQHERLLVYQTALADIMRRQRGFAELPALLMPLFQLAQQRSDAGGDAAAENRAALLVLATHVAGRPLASWLPDAASWPRVPRRPALLAGRWDFAVHLLVSAVLAAEGGGVLADALGLAKELGDARHGSGFSFTDLAINRAGTRLGERAVREPVRMQALLARELDAQALLPDLSDLPEFLSEPEFHARYGGVGEPAYEALTASIEARVDAMPLWR
jgi:hypothetical protein